MAENAEAVGLSSSTADKYAGSQVSFGTRRLKGKVGSSKFEYNMASAIETTSMKYLNLL
jgi:hypothetical protein